MKRAIISILISVLWASTAISGCWSSLEDHWAQVETDTETDTYMDGGECYEDDTDNCEDAGI